VATPKAVPLSLGSYTTLDPRASGKRLVGCMAELADQDSPADAKSTVEPAWLRRMAGIRNLTGINDNSGLPARGMWEMAGVQYVVIGPNLYAMNLNDISQSGSLVGPLNTVQITGNGFVRMSDNGACLVILQPGTINAWTYGPNADNRTITGITQAANAVITFNTVSAANPYAVGSDVVIQNVVGMTQINGLSSLVTAIGGASGAWTITTNINSSAFTGYVSGGTINPVFAPILAPFFLALGALDLWFVDSYIVFLALNGLTFFNDDGRIVSGNNQITFNSAASFSREFGTDLFVGGATDHREVMLFGTRTSEGYVNAGNPTGSPFAAAPDSFISQGCHPLCGYTVGFQDQTIFWVANDLTVRRRNGQTPMRVSNSGVEQILQQIASPIGNAGTLRGAYALTPTVSGHPLFIIQLPNAISPEGLQGRTLCYDCLTSKWFELASFAPSGSFNQYGSPSVVYNGTPLGGWRALCYYNGLGGQLIGDSLTSQVGILDPAIFTEFGTPQCCEFTLQSFYNQHQRVVTRRIEAVITPGQGASMTVAPVIDMFMSTDGFTYTSFQDPQTLGLPGQSDNRAQWWNLGQSRDLSIKFRVTDPSPTFLVDVQGTFEPGTG